MRLDELSLETASFASGLRAMVLPMPWTHRVGVTLHFRVGPLYEDSHTNGISHFLEHMTCRGIPRHPSAHEQALAFEALGGTIVAETGTQSGALTVALPTESLDEILPLLAETFTQPLFRDIEVEKGIVREEILDGLDEDGRAVDPDDLVRAACFASHPLGLPIIGTLERVEGFTVEHLRRHHARHYVGPTAVIAVAGPVDADAVLRSIDEHFAGLAAERLPSVPAPAPRRAPECAYVRHTSSQTALRVAFRAPPALHPDATATELLLRTLDDGMSTRLYHRICDERGLCYDVSASYEAFEQAGIVEIAAECAHERSADVLGEMLAVVRELGDEGPSAAELDRAKARHGWELIDLLDDPDELAELAADAELSGMTPHPARQRDHFEAVSLAHCRDVAGKLLRGGDLTVLAVGMQTRRQREKLERLTREMA